MGANEFNGKEGAMASKRDAAVPAPPGRGGKTKENSAYQHVARRVGFMPAFGKKEHRFQLIAILLGAALGIATVGPLAVWQNWSGESGSAGLSFTIGAAVGAIAGMILGVIVSGAVLMVQGLFYGLKDGELDE
jgi:hypothetical protein